VCDGNDEEGVAAGGAVSHWNRYFVAANTYLSSAIPASALYHDMKAAKMPK
jgi:hypothetical protein